MHKRAAAREMGADSWTWRAERWRNTGAEEKGGPGGGEDGCIQIPPASNLQSVTRLRQASLKASLPLKGPEEYAIWPLWSTSYSREHSRAQKSHVLGLAGHRAISQQTFVVLIDSNDCDSSTAPPCAQRMTMVQLPLFWNKFKIPSLKILKTLPTHTFPPLKGGGNMTEPESSCYELP